MNAGEENDCVDLVPILVPRTLFNVTRPYPAMVNETTVTEYFSMTEADYLEAVRRGKIKARKFQGKRYVAFDELRKLLSPKRPAESESPGLLEPIPATTGGSTKRTVAKPKVDDSRLEAVIKRSIHRIRR